MNQLLPFPSLSAQNENMLSLVYEQLASGTPASVATPGGVDGERRSLRACGRRLSGFGGFGSGGGGGSVGGSGGGGGNEGRGCNVVVPCHPVPEKWSELVRTHDETRHRKAIASARKRLGMKFGIGYGAECRWPDEDEEDSSKAEAEKKSEGVGQEMKVLEGKGGQDGGEKVKGEVKEKPLEGKEQEDVHTKKVEAGDAVRFGIDSVGVEVVYNDFVACARSDGPLPWRGR